MKICVLSDLHGILPNIEEDSEITLICGDIVPLKIQRNIPQSKKWLETDFLYWVNKLPTEKVYFIGGNHDFIFDGHFSKTDALILNRIANGKLCYLDGFTTIDHLSNDGFTYHIFGTPYCHIFGNWAFMREDDMLKKLYDHIPTECDILFSHDAADMNGLGIVPPNAWHPTESVNAGNSILTEAIKEKKPRYYFCGHIHEGNHEVSEFEGTICANVSILDDKYENTFSPLFLEITK